MSVPFSRCHGPPAEAPYDGAPYFALSLLTKGIESIAK